MEKKPGASDYSKTGEGVSPTIPFTEGMLLDLQVEDRGAQAILIDDTDESVLQDADGNVLFDRINN